MWLLSCRRRFVPGSWGLVFLAVCGATQEMHASDKVAPAAAKWVGPLMPGPAGGQTRTTLYYGPWQCNQRWMDYCQRKCTSEGHKLMGCIWLADIKTDWQGRYPGFPMAAGGRYAVTHCCCDYPKVTDAAERRDKWKGARDAFRRKWSEEFGN